MAKKEILNFLFFIGILCACEGTTNKHRGLLQTEEESIAKTQPLSSPLLIIDTNTLNMIENKVSGSGRILFKQPLFGLYSKELYFIQARLQNENSSLMLHSHFTGFKHTDGIKLFFIKEKNNLIIKIATPKHPFQIAQKKENYFDQNQNLEMYVELKNGAEDFVRFKIWNTYINPTGYVKQVYPYLSKRNLMADSENLTFYSKGQGLLWGIQLNKAELIKAERKPINQ